MKGLPCLQDHVRYANEVFKNLEYDGNRLSPDAFPGRRPYIVTDRPLELSALNHLGDIISHTKDLSHDQVEQGVFYVYFTYDSDALPVLRDIRRRGGVMVSPHPMMVAGKKTHYSLGINRLAHQALVKTAQTKGVSHLHLDVHTNICEALDITRDLEGDYLEIGVYKGGSALTALNFIDEMSAAGLVKHRHCWFLDTFDGFTYEDAQDGFDPLWKNTHRLQGASAAMTQVQEILSKTSNPFTVVQNNVCRENLPSGIGSLVVANIDVDMYEPTLAALQKVSPKMVPGGIIMCEDPPSTPSLYGALLAMEEFLDSEQGRCYTKIFKGGHYFLIRR